MESGNYYIYKRIWLIDDVIFRYGSYGLIKLDGWNIFINLLFSESKQIKKEENDLKSRQGRDTLGIQKYIRVLTY